MEMVAFWFQDSDMAAVASSSHWIMIFTGLVAFSMVLEAIFVAVLIVKLLAVVKDVMATFDAVKAKVFPLIESSKELVASSKEMLASAQGIVSDVTPKIKTITDNLVETSHTVRSTSDQLQKTVADANMRTQRQVARVDGMVSAALTTTGEIVETINHGIRVPAQKIAVMATQAKSALDGAVDKLKSMAGSLPFAKRKVRPGYGSTRL